MRILLTNDDGILAPGLAAMHRELLPLGDVVVVAPSDQRSAVAHGITLPGPIAVHHMHVGEAFAGYSVEGLPADCVKIALASLLDAPPNLVVSGINDGANASINVLYSGTVAAAAEGALLGVGSVAVSLERGDAMDFDRAARIARQVIEQLLRSPALESARETHGFGVASRPGRRGGWLVNLNIPALGPGVPKGVRVVRQSTQRMEDFYRQQAGPDGAAYYWLEGKFDDATHQTETDLEALREGYVALTPLHFDLTMYEALAGLQSERWTLEGM